MCGFQAHAYFIQFISPWSRINTSLFLCLRLHICKKEMRSCSPKAIEKIERATWLSLLTTVATVISFLVWVAMITVQGDVVAVYTIIMSPHNWTKREVLSSLLDGVWLTCLMSWGKVTGHWFHLGPLTADPIHFQFSDSLILYSYYT